LGNQNRSNSTGGRAVRWLHIPKAGSTLGVSLMAYGCTPAHPAWHVVYMALAQGQIDIRMGHALDARYAHTGTRCDGRLWMPFVGHEPVHSQRELLTRPGGALAHAAAASARGGGLAAMFRRPSQRLISAFLDNYHASGMTNRSHMKELASTVDLWAHFPGVAGCQTKMLAGLDCGALVPAGKLDNLGLEKKTYAGHHTQAHDVSVSGPVPCAAPAYVGSRDQ